jgi:hypothetical protein
MGGLSPRTRLHESPVFAHYTDPILSWRRGEPWEYQGFPDVSGRKVSGCALRGWLSEVKVTRHQDRGHSQLRTWNSSPMIKTVHKHRASLPVLLSHLWDSCFSFSRGLIAVLCRRSPVIESFCAAQIPSRLRRGHLSGRLAIGATIDAFKTE